MPRKITNKCCYCYRSKLTDADFELLLYWYLVNLPASSTASIFRAMASSPKEYGIEAFSEKTINRYYKRIGEKFFELFVEPNILRKPDIAELKKNDPEQYAKEVDAVLQAAHEDALNPFAQEYKLPTTANKPWAVTGIAIEYKKVSCSRNGVSTSIKANIGLAHVKDWYNQHAISTKKEYDFDELHRMCKCILKENPC